MRGLSDCRTKSSQISGTRSEAPKLVILGGFGELVDSALRELNSRLGDDLSSFLEPRFRPYRFIDSKEDAAANAGAAVDATRS